MIVSDVAIRVKRQFGDESGVQVTDDDIIRWVNDAQHEIGQAQEILEAVATTLSVADQANYILPTDIISLKRVLYDGKNVKNVSRQEYDRYITDATEAPGTNLAVGTPEIFFSFAEEINFYPVPNEADKEVKLYYAQFPADVVLLTDDLTLPVKWHTRIVEYCLQMAYEMDENMEAASIKSAQLQNSLAAMGEDVSWTSHEYYPNVVVMPEDL